MSYSDGLQILYPVDSSGDPEVVQAEMGATQSQFYMPVAGQIEDFGVYVTETFSAQATDAVVTLKKMTSEGGTETSIVALTLGSSNANLKKGDGTRAAQTAIAADTDLVNGHIVLCKRSALPVSFDAGDILIIENTTQQTGAGGAYTPFILVRLSSVQPEKTTVWVQDD